MSRKKQAELTTGSKMKGELRDMSLENEMMKKTIAEKRKYLAELKAMKAEEELLVGGEGDGEGFQEGRPRRPYDRSPDGQIERTEAFGRTLEQFTNTEGSVEVYRLEGNDYAKMGSFPAKDWGTSLESVALKFGGGTYKVRLRDPDGQLAGETIAKYAMEAYPRPSTKAAESAGSGSIDLFKMITEREEKNQERVLGMFTQMMNTLAQTIGGKTNMISNMNDLEMFKRLFADKENKNPDGTLQVEKLLNMFQTGMEFGAKTSGGDGEMTLPAMIMKVLSGDGLPKLTEVLKASIGAQPALPQRRPPARPLQRPLPVNRPVRVSQIEEPAPSGAEVTDEILPPANPQAQEENNMFGNTFMGKAYRKILLGYAEKDSDPEAVAHMIVGRVSGINESWLLIMDDFLKISTTKEEWVYANAPELRQYDTWVTETMYALKSQIAEYIAEIESEENGGQSVQPVPAIAPKPKVKKKEAPAPAPDAAPEGNLVN